MPLCPPRALHLTGSLAQAWASFVVFSRERRCRNDAGDYPPRMMPSILRTSQNPSTRVSS